MTFHLHKNKLKEEANLNQISTMTGSAMWCGRELRRSAPPRIFYHSYALLSIYLVLSTANNCLQSTNSPVYPDGHASSTGKFLVAESDGLHRVRVHDTLKRKGFMSTRTNY